MKLYKAIPKQPDEIREVQALKINIKEANFPEELLLIHQLKELYLEGVCEEFAPKIPFWEKLQTLSLKWPQFKGDLGFLYSLPELSNLKIIDTPLKRLRFPLGHSASPIKFLTLKNCHLSEIPQEISILENICELNLSGNNLRELPESFSLLKNLKRLNLDQNHFSLYPKVLTTMPHLSHVSLDGNPFPDEEKERIQREYHLWVS